MMPQHKEWDPRHTRKASQNCSVTAVQHKMMSSTRHMREQALLLLQLGLQHYGTEKMKGNDATWPLRTINLIQTPRGNLKQGKYIPNLTGNRKYFQIATGADFSMCKVFLQITGGLSLQDFCLCQQLDYTVTQEVAHVQQSLKKKALPYSLKTAYRKGTGCYRQLFLTVVRDLTFPGSEHAVLGTSNVFFLVFYSLNIFIIIKIYHNEYNTATIPCAVHLWHSVNLV